jgi:ketosteroid isomerase-like protein
MTTAAFQAGTGVMPCESRAAAAVRAFFAAYRARDVEGMVDLCTEGADFRYVPFEVWSRQRVLHGDGKVCTVGKMIWTTLIEAFPDLTNAVTSLRADPDGNVTAEVGISGTQARDFGTMACTGGHYELPHLFLLHVTVDGLIDDIVAYWDNVDWKRQLGCLEVD